MLARTHSACQNHCLMIISSATALPDGSMASWHKDRRALSNASETLMRVQKITSW